VSALFLEDISGGMFRRLTLLSGQYLSAASAVAAGEDEANNHLQRMREGGGLAPRDALWRH